MSFLDPSETSIETPDPGDSELHMPGKFIYEYSPQVTRVVDYGTAADALWSGQVSPPPEGARIDFYLEGPVTGPKLKGTINGVDYLYFRADGRAQLHIHAEIRTEEGNNIALAADGIAVREEGSSLCQLRENVTLLTNHIELAWVNALQVWATGTVDLANGEVRVKGYAV
jgi:Protein of unknown function (DUF3237)